MSGYVYSFPVLSTKIESALEGAKNRSETVSQMKVQVETVTAENKQLHSSIEGLQEQITILQQNMSEVLKGAFMKSDIEDILGDISILMEDHASRTPRDRSRIEGCEMSIRALEDEIMKLKREKEDDIPRIHLEKVPKPAPTMRILKTAK